MQLLADLPSESWRDYALHWVDRPAARWSSGRQGHLLDALCELATRTYQRDIGGYFHNQKDYLANVTRMVLVRRGDLLVGFLAFNDGLVVGTEPVLYLTSAIVAPDHQRHGLAGYAVVCAMIDRLTEVAEFHFALRTQNPVVYAPFAAVFDDVHPALQPRPMAAATRRFAEALAARLSPECEFDARRCVIKGLYRFSQRFFDAPPRSGWPEVDRLFLEQLDFDRQDGFLVFGRVTPRILADAVARLPLLADLGPRLDALAGRRPEGSPPA